MRLDTLHQLPLNYTLIGALAGAARHYGIEVSNPYLYGATGQGFLMNIHNALCPSGPYCWNREPFYGLLRNIGIAARGLGFHHAGTSAADRARSEAEVRAALDRGDPCILVNMEYQLITGYDETGLLTAQPWPPHDFPPAHLTFETWSELGDGIHLDFYVLSRCEPAPRAEAVLASLRYGVDLWRRPGYHENSQDYGIGARAYEQWTEAVKSGHGSSHGNWWNGTVWSECREQCSRYLREVADVLPAGADWAKLADEFGGIGALLDRCSSKELADDEKLTLLAEAAEREAACIDTIEGAL